MFRDFEIDSYNVSYLSILNDEMIQNREKQANADTSEVVPGICLVFLLDK